MNFCRYKKYLKIEIEYSKEKLYRENVKFLYFRNQKTINKLMNISELNKKTICIRENMVELQSTNVWFTGFTIQHHIIYPVYVYRCVVISDFISITPHITFLPSGQQAVKLLQIFIYFIISFLSNKKMNKKFPNKYQDIILYK